jgi:hypothetical protein
VAHKLAFLTVAVLYEPVGNPRVHAHGSSAFAFNFAKPFDASGNPCRLDRSAMEAKARQNAALHK